MSVSVRNTSAADQTPFPAPTRDGRPYTFEMIHDGGSTRTYADTPAELVAALIPGYEDLTGPQEQVGARIRLAVDVQVRLQAALVMAGDLDACAPQEREILLGSRDVPPSPAAWDCPIPLVLVTTFYRPVGRIARPEGPSQSLVWLDPSTDWDLLVSLHTSGTIQVSQRTGSGGADAQG